VTQSFESIVADKHRSPTLVMVFYCFAILGLINCYLTPNPYSATHSGNAGRAAAVISESWAISPAWLIAAAMSSVALFTVRTTSRDLPLVAAFIVMWLSGVSTESYVPQLVTYIYEPVVFLMCASLAYRDAHGELKRNWENRLLPVVIILMLFGASMSFFRPETFGHFGDFTREKRGEVTVWLATGVVVFVGPLMVLGVYKARNWYTKYIWWAPLCGWLLVTLLEHNRGAVVFVIVGMLGISYILKSGLGKVTVILVALLGAVFAGPLLLDYILIGHGWDEFFEDSRIKLWEINLNLFRDNVLFGIGPIRMEQALLDSPARSEIGMLRWFSNYGVVFGGVMTYVTFRGVWGAIRLLGCVNKARNEIRSLDVVCAVTVLLSILEHVFSNYSRILDFHSFAYWYSLLYSCYRYKRITLCEVTNEALDTSRIAKA
jgi:hypothetical protein